MQHCYSILPLIDILSCYIYTNEKPWLDYFKKIYISYSINPLNGVKPCTNEYLFLKFIAAFVIELSVPYCYTHLDIFYFLT